jgi:ATP-binding cassette, subfamily B, bacterial
MLPLCTPDEQTLSRLAKENIPVDSITAALYVDLRLDGSFGKCWLFLSNEKNCLYRYCEYDDSFESWDLDRLSEPYMDNYSTSCRLLVHLTEEPFAHDLTKEESEAVAAKAPTICICGCTNACKKYMVAFLQIWERTFKGEELHDDDPLFEQFNARCPKCGRPFKDQRRKICEYCTGGKHTILRILKYFGKFKWQLTKVLICLLATSAISLLSPLISGKLLYDQVISEPTYDSAGNQLTGSLHDIRYVYAVVFLIFGLAVVSLIIGIVQSRANAEMSNRVTATMKKDIFTALQKLSLSYYNQNPTGRLISRVDNDVVRIRSFFIDGVPYLIINVLNFIGLAIFLFMINWKLTLIVFVPVPIIILIFKHMLPKLWHSYSIGWRRSSSMNTVMADSLNGVRVVKAFAKEDAENERFAKYAKKLYEVNLYTNLITLTIFPVANLLIGMSSQAIWGFGGLQVMGGNMTYGEFTTYLGYIGMIFNPLYFFSTFTNIFTDAANSATRMFETLDTTPDIVDAPDAVPLETISKEIKFDRVHFHYTPNRMILKDLSFTIHAGDHVGIVGHTGSGKSTIANLIMRMYDVVSGSVSIDGTDIKKIKIEDLRRNIAIVSQEIFLFRGTIADNIRYAKPNASMAEVIAAARAANAHDFILSLPEGYQTMVGSGSRSLSGGERQRISIARALLLSPSLLILDEATAAMDTETERLISEAIDKLIVGRTSITIAHRLSTLKNCDYIMAIENGELAEMGTHAELLEKKGVFYRLYTLQSEQLQKVKSGV